MAGYVMKMSNLVSNVNRRELKDYLSKPATKVYATRWRSLKIKSKKEITYENNTFFRFTLW